jgi:acyl transferase domain-containing protein/3-hydroxymyristoyl/3-hydroxydecanoyl-(acyl carrier protein) dehydratase
MTFEPIAIVGRGCVFPGAFSPAELWSLIERNATAISECPEGRWRMPKDRVLGDAAEHAWTDRGGYIAGFERIFNPRGFAISPEEIASHDVTVRWLLHTAREALREAGWERAPERSGAIFGLLGLPSDSMAQYAEQVWAGETPAVVPANRFLSGLPAHLLAAALQLDGGAFALDAACASSLYALKFACDALHDRRADLMLAGGVNRADDLFLHIGFSTLKAISRTGASRPFHANADGLLPSEGAAFVVLQRLDDAKASGARILGVIRGIGLSNDGRTAGLLTPSEDGQEQAMRAAYRESGLAPSQISLIECHATGTTVGDACEIRSTSRVFDGTRGVPIGSVKSNLGHPITAAGMAGLLKILGAMEHRIRPATLGVDAPSPALDKSPFRLLLRNEPWETRDARRAALSAFGFGGNNAHLIVEEYANSQDTRVAHPLPVSRDAAVVALGICAGDAADSDGFTRAVFRAESRETRIDEIALELDPLGFPPLDLKASLPQQIAALRAAAEALQNSGPLSGNVGVFVGMGTDTEVARFGLRWRSGAEGACEALTAPGVIGRLANIVANRISSRFDLRGPSVAVMAEELSGIRALEVAARALGARELDYAVVGAVDLSCEPVHESAARAVLPADKQKAGDAAVFLVLQRAEDAGGRSLATIHASGVDGEPLVFDHPFGHAHAASGLLDVAVAVLSGSHRAVVPAAPNFAARKRPVRVDGSAIGGARSRVVVGPGEQSKSLLLEPPPRIFTYSGLNQREVLESLRLGRTSSSGPARLSIVASSERELETKRQKALANPATWSDGIYYRETPLAGELAMVFPGAAAAYRGMGRSLALAFPGLLDEIDQYNPSLIAASSWTFETTDYEATPLDKLWGSSLLSQFHARFTRGLLGLAPPAAIGISSGETNSLLAFGAWRDPERFFHEFTASGALDRFLGGAFEVTGGVRWASWQLSIPREELETLLARFPEVRLTGQYAPNEFAVAGEAGAISRAIQQLGPGRAQRLNYDLVVHCPDFLPYANAWRDLHDRETFSSEPRFYTHATGTHYRPHRESIAQALTEQAAKPIDFPSLVEQAWQDGVRIFLEQGPQGGCASRIRRILGSREHISIPMDLAGEDALRQAANSVAQLIAAGVDVPGADVFERLAQPTRTAKRTTFTMAAHAAPVRLPRKPAVSSPVAIETFRLHARALAVGYSNFLEGCGAATHEQFLETSRRAFLHVAGQTVAAPVPVPAQHVRFGREELIRLASGPVSPVLGPEFQSLDTYRRVVRLPMPPLLLADRVTDIRAKALSMGTGSLFTETDVHPDAWYLHRGRMPAGIMIESGQADLLLISWLGIDNEVKGERVYRLLGCDLTYHGGLPQPGDTLRYDIHLDRHARQGEVRLFFFHYDCRIGNQPRLSVRNGQAGFFTEEELANSAGVLNTPDPPPHVPHEARSYSQAQVRAAADGRAFDCFGAGFEYAAAHQRSPGFARPDLLLLDTVTRLDPPDSPGGRGYLRAELPIRPDLWFFEGHFKDDPCMPGTLMFEGCLQTMAFYMMSAGLTLERDGWRFEPVPDVPYSLRCRGQVIPESKLLVYEVFVDSISDGPEPVLFADLLCTVDGLKAFHCRRMGLRLTPGHPLDDGARNVPMPAASKPVASVNGVPLDFRALLACAWGSPVDAFGPPLARFAAGERLPRLPGPPYHFMTRVVEIDGEFGVERQGSTVIAEYDVDPALWGSGIMPLAVLMEIALQPCGWLGCFSGIPLRADTDLFFRNLDGSATLPGRRPETDGVIRTRSRLLNVARSGGITLTSFDVRCEWNGEPVLEMQTTFGFFRKSDLARQAGLPPAAGEAADSPAPLPAPIDLTSHPARYFAGPLPLISGDLLMLDRITAYREHVAERGWVRAEKDVSPSDWFFQAHFYQDPVQPGSLGLEALVQALQVYAIHSGIADQILDPVFLLDGPLAWKYRGQVLPANRRIVAEVRIKDVQRTRDAVVLRAEGWLWVDGVRIYHFTDFGQKVTSRTSR